MFCSQFQSLNEAQTSFPREECEDCKYQSYKNGLMTCKKITDSINNQLKREGKEKINNEM